MQNKPLRIALTAIVAVFPLLGFAGDRPMYGAPQGATLDGYGYARFTAIHAPTTFSDAPTFGNVIHPQARSAEICAETATLYWRDDGIDPTGLEGMTIAAGNCRLLYERATIDAFRFISAETLAAELLTQTCAGWGLGAPVGAWSCAGSVVTRTASASDLAITNTVAVAGTTYKIVWTIATLTAGDVTFAIGGTSGTTQTAAGTYTEYITAGDTTAATITASADAAGTIVTEVSVKALTGTAVARVRYGW